MAYVGVLIDPHTRTVTAIELPSDSDPAAMSKLLDADYFDTVALRRPSKHEPGAALYVDELGLSREGQKFWSFSVRPDQIFGGKGVVAAIDIEGATTYGIALPEAIAARVVWRNVRFIGIDDVVVEPRDGFSFEVHRVPKFEPLEEET